MALLQEWRDYAYSQEMSQGEKAQMFWANYFELEKGIYEQLLNAPETVIEGTVQELADKYDVKLSMMVGFLDGINDSLNTPNPIDTMEADTKVSIDCDNEKLYYNMVGAKADWLYELPQWDDILTKERRKELFLEQKKSNTIRVETKVGRNEPCPCGSGKKYKQCCGK